MPSRILTRAAVAFVAFALGAAGLVALGGAASADPVGFTVIKSPAGGVCQLAHVDLTTGELTPFGPTDAAHCTFDLAVSPGGTALYGTTLAGTIGNGPPPNGATAIAQLMRYDPTTGVATNVGQIGNFTLNGPPGDFQGNLTFDRAGNLFVFLVPNFAAGTTPCDYQSFCLYRVDPTNPANATPIGHVPQNFIVYAGLAATCGGSVLSARATADPNSFQGSTATSSTSTTSSTTGPATNANSGWSSVKSQSLNGQTLTSVNTATGSTTDIGSGMGANDAILSLDFDGSGGVWGVGSSSSIFHAFTIDPSAGTAATGAALTPASTVEALAIGPPCPPTPAVVVAPRFTG